MRNDPCVGPAGEAMLSRAIDEVAKASISATDLHKGVAINDFEVFDTPLITLLGVCTRTYHIGHGDDTPAVVMGGRACWSEYAHMQHAMCSATCAQACYSTLSNMHICKS